MNYMIHKEMEHLASGLLVSIELASVWWYYGIF